MPRSLTLTAPRSFSITEVLHWPSSPAASVAGEEIIGAQRADWTKVRQHPIVVITATRPAVLIVAILIAILLLFSLRLPA